mgnify:CR=1 FL=1
MITASGIELRAGSRILLEGASFRVAAGDRVAIPEPGTLALLVSALGGMVGALRMRRRRAHA